MEGIAGGGGCCCRCPKKLVVRMDCWERERAKRLYLRERTAASLARLDEFSASHFWKLSEIVVTMDSLSRSVAAVVGNAARNLIVVKEKTSQLRCSGAEGTVGGFIIALFPCVGYPRGIN